MQFSKSGNYFAIVKKHGKKSGITNELAVYKSNDIYETMNDIEIDNPVLRIDLPDDEHIKMIRFDLKDQFVAVASKTTVEIFSIKGDHKKRFVIDPDKYSLILDMVLDSS